MTWVLRQVRNWTIKGWLSPDRYGEYFAVPRPLLLRAPRPAARSLPRDGPAVPAWYWPNRWPETRLGECLCKTVVPGQIPCVLSPTEPYFPRPTALFQRYLPGRSTLRQTRTQYRGVGIRRRRPSEKRKGPRQPRPLVRVDQSLPSEEPRSRCPTSPPEHAVAQIPTIPRVERCLFE